MALTPPFYTQQPARSPSSPFPLLIHPNPQALPFNYRYWLTIDPDPGPFDGPDLLQCCPQAGILSVPLFVSFPNQTPHCRLSLTLVLEDKWNYTFRVL